MNACARVSSWKNIAIALSLALVPMAACSRAVATGESATGSTSAGTGGAVPDAGGTGGAATDAACDGAPDPACADAAADAGCPAPPACNQPANPCAAGYIVSSFSYAGIETIVCFTDSSETTETTAACGPGEVLFVDDSPGSPCLPPDAGSCGDGWYLFKPGCCITSDVAYCVPAPECCGGALDCGCANAACEAYCTITPFGPPPMCVSAGCGVLHCFCGNRT